MKKTNLFFTLLICSSLLSSPIIQAAEANNPSKEANANMLRNAYSKLEKRTAKLMRCLKGKEACTPGDFVAIISLAMIVDGFVHAALYRQLPKKMKMWPSYSSPGYWAVKAAERIIPERN